MTEEDVKRIIAEHALSPRHDPHLVDMRDVQWSYRNAFEEGWRAAGGSPERSHHMDEPKGWRLAWLQSNTRDFLVRKGMISGEDTYK